MSEILPKYQGGYNNQGGSDVKRVSSGGVKSGLPLIITGGQKRHDLFHYNFSDKGKYKKQPRPGEVEIRVNAQIPAKQLQENLKFKLPRNFCPDCNRMDREHKEGSINVWTMVDGERGVDLLPGDVVISFWCQECQMNALYGKKIEIPSTANPLCPEELDDWRKSQIRQVRMDRNIGEFVRNRLIADDKSIYVISRQQGS
jgi:hypothetical protein